jgi:hypothetical protein
MNRFIYIEKRVFEIFFRNNNTLDISLNPLVCSDINEFVWILQQRDQLRDKLSANCDDQSELLDKGFLISYNIAKFSFLTVRARKAKTFSNCLRKLPPGLNFEQVFFIYPGLIVKLYLTVNLFEKNKFIEFNYSIKNISKNL